MDTDTSCSDIDLVKYETLGNSYLVLDLAKSSVHGVLPSPQWIRALCDKNYGIGSNGLIVGPLVRDKMPFEFSIFNSDGSLAELSGNGARIFSRYLMDAGYVPDSDRSGFAIAAVSNEQQRIQIGVQADRSINPEIFTSIKVRPRFGPDAVNAREAVTCANGVGHTVSALADMGRRGSDQTTNWLDSSLISIGNPHCVTFVPSRELLPTFNSLTQRKDEFSLIADASTPERSNPIFIKGCNLQWCFVETRRTIHLRIIERGEGPTLASGSSASAATIAAFARGVIDDQVSVIMPGGAVTITLSTEKNEVRSVMLSAVVNRLATIRLEPQMNLLIRHPAAAGSKEKPVL